MEGVGQTGCHLQAIGTIDMDEQKPEVTVFVCNMKCQHVWDGPIVEVGSVTTSTCSKCGASAFDVSMWEGA